MGPKTTTEAEFLMPSGQQYKYVGKKTVELNGKKVEVVQMEML